MRKRLVAAISLLLPFAAAAVDDSALRTCRELRDPAARLACYDGLPLGTPGAVPAPPGPAVPRSPAAPPRPAAAPAAPSAPATPESTFGMEGRAPVAELPALDTYIPGTFYGWSQHTTIRLANGQVWQVMDESSRRMRLQDPKVRIRRGLMGAFYLEFEAHNYAPRVRRLE